jgi:hypothetical protein
MKNLHIIIFLVLGNCVFGQTSLVSIQTKTNFKIPNDAIKGDYNGDGKIDYMWLESPQIDEENMDCVGQCNCLIKFSDPTIPSIEITDCIGGNFYNEGDLNKNGNDEIGLTPGWFTSCWRTHHVWTFKSGAWLKVVSFPIHCDQADGTLIEVDNNKEGHVIIRYSEQPNGGDIITRVKSIKII